MSVKNIDLYKRVVEAEKKEDAVMEGSFKRINNQAFDISTKEQVKTLMTCTGNKRWILDDNANTLAFGHYRLKEMKRRSCFRLWTPRQYTSWYIKRATQYSWEYGLPWSVMVSCAQT